MTELVTKPARKKPAAKKRRYQYTYTSRGNRKTGEFMAQNDAAACRYAGIKDGKPTGKGLLMARLPKGARLVSCKSVGK